MQIDLEALQHELQRKLGRCMLRLQQYERLLKSIVAHTHIEGPAESLLAEGERNEASLSKKSLGTLVKMFAGNLSESTDTVSSAKTKKGSGDQESEAALWVSIHLGISMSAADQDQTKRELAELVDMRNELVHHFIGRFDIGSEDGCISGSSHLDQCYTRIEHHCQRLRIWAQGQAEARRQLSSWMATAAFRDALVDGILPDGTVQWEASGIVNCLRDAETVCRVAEWTLLDTAIRFIAGKYQDQQPSRYGCKTWRQVLKSSGQFEWRVDPGGLGEKGEFWYRSLDTET
jgi:hypothetical protein